MEECSVCSQLFTLKKNLYQHMRRKHKIEPQVPGKLICPLKCREKFCSQKSLRDHLNSIHEQTIEMETHEFSDCEAFELWKHNLELSSGYSYIRRMSETLTQKGVLKTHFSCNRSGVFKSISKGIRKLKKSNSNKIGYTCPAVMEVSKSPFDGGIKVIHWKTHLGHEADITRLRTRKSIRNRKSKASVSYPVCAVLPAAGTGERMGLNTPKQFIPVHRKPLICYTVEAFLKIPYIDKIVVVAAPQNLEMMLQTLSQMCMLQGERVMVTEGAVSRHQSIESGLKALKTCDIFPEVVVIHDGVRPFISEEIVCNVVTAAKEHGAAGVTCPLVSTVISANDDGFLDVSLDRNKFRASEMPQAFQYNLICQAYEKCSTYDLEHGTECLHLIQKYMSIRPKLLPGTSNLWKITHRKDIYTAAAMVKENQSVGIVAQKPLPSFVSHLRVSLAKCFKDIKVARYCDINISKLPNLVLVQNNNKLYDIIEQMTVLCSSQKLTEPASTVSIINVLFTEFDTDINFLELQKQAKICAKKLKTENTLVYYVLWRPSDPEDTFEEKSELITSLLFESNPNISGTIFLS